MPRYTSAYSSFVHRLGEIVLLQQSAASKERLDAMRYRNEINAFCRGAIVLLCAHLEAYIKELGELALDKMYSKQVKRDNVCPRLFYHISKSVINEIKETIDHDKIAGKVFDFIDTELNYWSKSGPFAQPIVVESFNKGFSNPSYDKVKVYFKRFGYEDYSTELAKRLNRDYQPVINMVDHLVDIRNKIAHGDPSVTKTPSEVLQMVVLIRMYCESTDNIFANWWKLNFCTIR